jgi:hypothetical protein
MPSLAPTFRNGVLNADLVVEPSNADESQAEDLSAAESAKGAKVRYRITNAADIPKLLGDVMRPAVGLCRAYPIAEAGKLPGMFQSMPEIQDFTPAHEHTGSIPDPLGAVADNHHHGVGSDRPSSRKYAYMRRKMSSASPRHVTRNRRTNERRPGEVSTRRQAARERR